MKKSELILVVEAANVEGLASVLGCKVGNLLTTYLGLLLGAPHKFVKVWKLLKGKFQ